MRFRLPFSCNFMVTSWNQFCLHLFYIMSLLRKVGIKFTKTTYAPGKRAKTRRLVMYGEKCRSATSSNSFRSLREPAVCDDLEPGTTFSQRMVTGKERKQTHQEKMKEQANQWQEVLKELVHARHCLLVPHTQVCSSCGETGARIRCSDCGPHRYFCSECEVVTHEELLHKPEIWTVIGVLIIFVL